MKIPKKALYELVLNTQDLIEGKITHYNYVKSFADACLPSSNFSPPSIISPPCKAFMYVNNAALHKLVINASQYTYSNFYTYIAMCKEHLFEENVLELYKAVLEERRTAKANGYKDLSFALKYWLNSFYSSANKIGLVKPNYCAYISNNARYVMEELKRQLGNDLILGDTDEIIVVRRTHEEIIYMMKETFQKNIGCNSPNIINDWAGDCIVLGKKKIIYFKNKISLWDQSPCKMKGILNYNE